MNHNDCIKFANENPACYLATTDGDQPRVRGFLNWFSDATGYYFHTAATKQVYKQLKSNPKIEVCFFNPDNPPGVGTMMRMAGEVEFVEDSELRSRLLEERPFLKAFVSGPDDQVLQIFRIYTGEAHFWTMENNMRESEIERIAF
jgi:uncharacterized pyridoxamine 5'-phosphate oxidase family protein